MTAGLILLCLAYVLSQFFRAFLAVLSGALGIELGAGADDLAFASGMWFLAFALMQLPVGWALDRVGPRRTAATLLLIGGGGGASVFAMATSPAHIALAMGLIGVGCAPVLMASYYIFARTFPPARFATLASLMLGVGSVGNLLASYPTALAAEWIGWRGTLALLALASVAVAGGILLTVRDPAPASGDQRGSLLGLLRLPALWAILPLMLVCYAPAGAIRGLWAGPYLGDVFGLDAVGIGRATLIMGLAMIAGTFCLGPLDRILGTRKWINLITSLASAAATLALAFWPDQSVVLSVALIAVIGFMSGNFPVIIAHGRALFPPHLVGRGVTLMNFFGIGGVGLMQFISGRMHAGAETSAAAYPAIFAFFGLAVLAGSLVYLASRDRID